ELGDGQLRESPRQSLPEDLRRVAGGVDGEAGLAIDGPAAAGRDLMLPESGGAVGADALRVEGPAAASGVEDQQILRAGPQAKPRAARLVDRIEVRGAEPDQAPEAGLGGGGRLVEAGGAGEHVGRAVRRCGHRGSHRAAGGEDGQPRGTAHRGSTLLQPVASSSQVSFRSELFEGSPPPKTTSTPRARSKATPVRYRGGGAPPRPSGSHPPSRRMSGSSAGSPPPTMTRAARFSS